MKVHSFMAAVAVAMCACWAPGADAAAVTAGVTIIEDGASRFVAATPFIDAGKLKYGIADVSPSGFVGATMDPDPFIDASLSIVDLGAPSTFEFHFVVPIVATTGPLRIGLAIGATCSDHGLDGCSGGVLFPSTFLAEGSLDGISHVFGGGSFSGPPGGPGGFGTLTFMVDLPSALTYSLLDLHIGFLGSGGGDAYGLSAKVQLFQAPAPAPQTLALALVALACMGVALRRRHGHDRA